MGKLTIKKLLLEKNEAAWDRALRILLGFILIWVYSLWLLPGLWNVLWLLIAAILIVTGVAGHCTLYSLFNFKTDGNA